MFLRFFLNLKSDIFHFIFLKKINVYKFFSGILTLIPLWKQFFKSFNGDQSTQNGENKLFTNKNYNHTHGNCFEHNYLIILLKSVCPVFALNPTTTSSDIMCWSFVKMVLVFKKKYCSARKYLFSSLCKRIWFYFN